MRHVAAEQLRIGALHISYEEEEDDFVLLIFNAAFQYEICCKIFAA